MSHAMSSEVSRLSVRDVFWFGVSVLLVLGAIWLSF
jgi:hypothetical protein